uniref:Uncharacterized protein n=1 Tax=Streptomyces sp. NBC_00049 TaxID=2903617 RepID=A0AAU2JKZ4_9ACTN
MEHIDPIVDLSTPEARAQYQRLLAYRERQQTRYVDAHFPPAPTYDRRGY